MNTYFPQAILPFMDREQPVISPLLSNVIAIAALLFTIWARLSLGRNIGFVPAQRELVTAGAYRYVRHPIYTGLILSYLAVALRIYSPRNLAAIAVFWMLVKGFVEESFLRTDPQYAAYMTRVRVRWIPFVILASEQNSLLVHFPCQRRPMNRLPSLMLVAFPHPL